MGQQHLPCARHFTVHGTSQCTVDHKEGRAGISMPVTGKEMESGCVEVTQLARGPRSSNSLSCAPPRSTRRLPPQEWQSG